MCVRILIIITKRPLRHATEVDVSVAKTLGQSVTKRLDHNKTHHLHSTKYYENNAFCILQEIMLVFNFECP